VTDGVRTRLAVTTGVGAATLLLGTVALKAAFGLLLEDDSLALGVVATLGGCAMAAVGALVAARIGNPIGWLLLAIPLATGVSQVAQTLAEHGAPEHADYAQFAHWLSSWPFFVSLILLVATFFLYPTGTIPSPRWRWVWRSYVTAGVLTVVGFAVNPYREDVAGVAMTNPLGIEAIHGPLSVVLGVSGLVIVMSAFASFVSLVVRYRATDAEGRQQLRWLFAVGAIGAALFVSLIVTVGLFGDESAFNDIVMVLLVTDVVVGIPVATALAILRYRLYDLDIVIKKTVVFGVLAGFISLLYVLVAVLPLAVIGTGRSDSPSLLPFAATILLVLFFQPVRRRARRFADRIVYGERATPYEVLSEFSSRLGEAYATDDVLPRTAQILANATGGRPAVVWLRVGSELRPAAIWPQGELPPARAMRGDDLPILAGDEHVVEVRHQGELLGALSVVMPANDPMDPTRERMVQDLAGQAGLVLRNVRLIEDLRASRQRLVAAQDEERRRIERNIHDGAQQQLVALAVQLKLARTMVDRDPARAGPMLDGLQAAATTALEDLRDLARGIYPPLLADRGLTAALEAQARRAALPVTVRSEGVGRFTQEIEAAVYFCSLEALNNVAKYAGASAADVRLVHEDGHLTFVVHDDGAGFEVATAARGTGLQGMTDRLEAIGGSLSVVSEPGAGTTVSGRVPVS
jgi:signal transduction histidine kinase